MELKRYTLILRRWFWLLLLAVACAGLAGWVFATEADTSYQAWQVILLVTVGGLIWGLAGIFGIEFLIDNVKTVEDVRRITPAPLLGAVEMPARNGRAAIQGPFEGPQSRSAPTYLSASLKLLQRGRLGYDRTVLVCSSQRTPYTSRVGANLAASAAMSGFPTLLVDANRSDSELTQSLNLEGEPGFAEALANPSSDVLVHLVPSIPNLHVLPGGVRAAADPVTFSTMHLRNVIDRSGAQGSLVVVVGPPVDSQSMLALGLAKAADDVVLLAVAEETKRRALRRTVNRLSEGGANLVGVVFMQRASRRAKPAPVASPADQTRPVAWTPLPPATPSTEGPFYVDEEVHWQGTPFAFTPWGAPQSETEYVPAEEGEAPGPPPNDGAPPSPIERPNPFESQTAVSNTVESTGAPGRAAAGLDYRALNALGAAQQAAQPETSEELDLEGLDTLGGELASAGPKRKKTNAPPEPPPWQPEPAQPPSGTAFEPEPRKVVPLWQDEVAAAPPAPAPTQPASVEPTPDIEMPAEPMRATASAAAIPAVGVPVWRPAVVIDVSRAEPAAPEAPVAEPIAPAPHTVDTAAPAPVPPAAEATTTAAPIVEPSQALPGMVPLSEVAPAAEAPEAPPAEQPAAFSLVVEQTEAATPIAEPATEARRTGEPDLGLPVAEEMGADERTVEVLLPTAYETMPIPLVPSRSGDEPLAAPGSLDSWQEAQRSQAAAPADLRKSAARADAGPNVISHLFSVLVKWFAVAATWRPAPRPGRVTRVKRGESPYTRVRTGAQLAIAGMVSEAAARRARSLEKKEARARAAQAARSGIPAPPVPQPIAPSTLSSREASLSEDKLINLWLHGADRARRRGDKKGAKELIDRVLDRDPRNQTAWDMRLALFELPEPATREVMSEARRKSRRPFALVLGVLALAALLGAGTYLEWPAITRVAKELTAGPPPTAAPAPVVSTPVPVATVVSRTFPGGYAVSGAFLDFWDRNGGVRIFGYPISAPLTEFTGDGKVLQVQYFERARLERHPENAGTPNEIMPGLIGTESPITGTVAPSLPAGLSGETVRIGGTGYEVPKEFYDFWNANGGTAIFGVPISKVLLVNLPGGNPLAVQYFERARFEYHPENAGTTNQIELTRLGLPVYQAKHPSK